MRVDKKTIISLMSESAISFARQIEKDMGKIVRVEINGNYWERK